MGHFININQTNKQQQQGPQLQLGPGQRPQRTSPQILEGVLSAPCHPQARKQIDYAWQSKDKLHSLKGWSNQTT